MARTSPNPPKQNNPQTQSPLVMEQKPVQPKATSEFARAMRKLPLERLNFTLKNQDPGPKDEWWLEDAPATLQDLISTSIPDTNPSPLYCGPPIGFAAYLVLHTDPLTQRQTTSTFGTLKAPRPVLRVACQAEKCMTCRPGVARRDLRRTGGEGEGMVGIDGEELAEEREGGGWSPEGGEVGKGGEREDGGKAVGEAV
ncbi:hypothetical protein D0865_15897 [Hortaea werneckii]|uniref:Uncharacterized protein n=1 Tax=Hortaea werneckii TaxID=91943 RepID=A0A3M7AK12_HORWE|nr:hypothetical protein D0865_15897 [Hortaea werneckii]